jgi:nucleoside-diphosphate-sugar epimerase
MLANAIAAARASGARLIFPGNVYNFGPDAGAVVDESSPQNPTTRKGAVRVEMERMLASEAADGLRSVGHAWAYLPDVAETIVRLADIERDLEPFDVFHFGGHWIEPGEEICHAVRRVTGRLDLPIRSFPGLASMPRHLS